MPRSYKSVFPFSLGTTSFIYPDDYVSNVKRIGPYLDEIELLFFESSRSDSLPAPTVINELSLLSENLDLKYNVHLPTDVSISHPERDRQHRAVDAIKEVLMLVSPLSPTTCTLHIDYSEPSFSAKTVSAWQDRVRPNLAKILDMDLDSSRISIETLDYPFELIEDVVEEFGLSVCLDLGHMILYGYDIDAAFKKYSDKTSIIHLHGVADDHDHLALDCLPDTIKFKIIEILRKFNQTVSLEVFSYSNLASSLNWLEAAWGLPQLKK